MGNILLRKTGLAVLQDVLLVQCGADEGTDVRTHLRDGAGLVVTSGTIDKVRSGGLQDYDGPLLIDRQRYAGLSRTRASAGITPSWIDRQRFVGVTAPLTDSGYVDLGDEAGLKTVLSQTAQLGADDVVAVLALHQQWMNDDADLLIEAVKNYGVPVALVVEHAKDPFGTKRNIHGLVRLLKSVDVPVLLLRSDLAALGAIAFGALSGAVGTRTGLRHLYPQPKNPRRRPWYPPPFDTALFDPGLYFVRVDHLALGVAALPDDPMWLCRCQTCDERRLDWMLAEATKEQVLAHNVELLLDRRDHMVKGSIGAERQQIWRAACASAQYQFASAAAVKEAGWEVPAQLRFWQEV